MRNLMAVLAVVALVGMTSQSASAHSAFKKAFEAKYNVKASCNACHMKKGKEVRNDFGKLYDKALEGKEITKKWKAAKEEGSAVRKEYEAGEMTTEFKKAMEVVGKQKKDGKSYDDIIKALEIEGLKAKS